MVKDIFDREIKLGDLVYAHEKGFLCNPMKEMIGIIVNNNNCFIKDFSSSSYRICKIDSCILLGHLNDSLRPEEEERRNHLIMAYFNYCKENNKANLLSKYIAYNISPIDNDKQMSTLYNRNFSYDILNRQVNPGDLVYLYNLSIQLNSREMLDVKINLNYLGLSIGKNKYIVYDKNHKFKELRTSSVYLLDDRVEEVKNFKETMLIEYRKFNNQRLKDSVKQQEFKSKVYKHKIGDTFVDSYGQVYLYLGRYRVNNREEKESLGHTYIKLNSPNKNITEFHLRNYLETRYPCDLDILCLRNYSQRFVDYYLDSPITILDNHGVIESKYNLYESNKVILEYLF